MALLDKLRTDCMNKAATTLQKGVRGFLARRRFAAAKRSVLLLQAAVRGYFARMEFKRMRALRGAITIQVGGAGG